MISLPLEGIVGAIVQGERLMANDDVSMRAVVAVLGVLLAVSVTSFYGLGGTTTGAEICRREVGAAGYSTISYDFETPNTLREAYKVQNYLAKKEYEAKLSRCEGDSRGDLVTCGFIKCGGLFSKEVESTVTRLEREKADADARSQQFRREYLEQKRLEERKAEERQRELAEYWLARAKVKLEQERIEMQRIQSELQRGGNPTR